MKKKLLSILIATTLVASLTTGCGNKVDNPTAETATEEGTTEDTTESTEETEEIVETVDETSTKDVDYYTEHINDILPSSEIMSVKMISTTSDTESADDFKMEILMENIDDSSLFTFSIGPGEMSMLTVADDVYASYDDGTTKVSGKIVLKDGETTEDVQNQAGSNDFTFTKIVNNFVSVDSVESSDNENIITATFKDLATDENNSSEDITITDDIDTTDVDEEDNTSDVEVNTENEAKDIQVKIYVDAETDEFHKLTFTIEDEEVTADCEMYIAKELSKTADDFGNDEISSEDVAGMMLGLIFGAMGKIEGNEIDFSDSNIDTPEVITDSVE